MVYKTKGTCSSHISFELIDGKLHNVVFTGGCNGNLKGIGALVEGQDAKEVISRLEGIQPDIILFLNLIRNRHFLKRF